MRKPTLIQLKGLIELITTSIVSPLGAGSDEYCVLPGKRKSGYCNEKVESFVLIPASIKHAANFSSKAAKLPLNGHAGPMMIN